MMPQVLADAACALYESLAERSRANLKRGGADTDVPDVDPDDREGLR